MLLAIPAFADTKQLEDDWKVMSTAQNHVIQDIVAVTQDYEKRLLQRQQEIDYWTDACKSTEQCYIAPQSK